MSLNPEIDRNGSPVLVIGEVLLVERGDIRLSTRIEDFSVQSGGTLFLTTIRLVFVADKPTSDFKALDIPLMCIRDEKFNMPIFGCNNLSMKVVPQNQWGYNSNFNAKFEFRSGGAQTFLRIFWKVMAGVNEARNIPVAQPIPVSVQEVASGSFINTVYVDPSDPSYVYTTQPYQSSNPLPANYPIPVYYSAPQQVNSNPNPAYVKPVQVPAAQPVQVPSPQQVNPTYVSPPQPSYVSAPQPTYVSPPQPTYVSPPQPTFVSVSQPTIVSVPQPTYVNPPQPTYVPPQASYTPPQQAYPQTMYVPPAQAVPQPYMNTQQSSTNAQYQPR